jgi:hypothetical protein
MSYNKSYPKEFIAGTSNAKDQALAQYSSIAVMVVALSVNYERLNELREMEEEARCNGDNLYPEEAGELTELEAAAGNCKDADEARDRIQEDALDVQVRGDWHTVGADMGVSEFYILLCTGGPAVRIMGELDEDGYPCRAWIEYQDWGTPWTMLDSMHIDHSVLLEYCNQFWFGE